MNSYKEKYNELVRGIIKKSFPALENKIIFLTENKFLNFQYSGVTNYFLFFSWIVIHPKVRNYSKSSKIALLAHELSHLDIIINKNFFEKIGFAIKFLFTKKGKIDFERNADLLAIKKGYGKDLISLRKDSWKGLSKQELENRSKRGYLSIKEIKGVM